ncbi:MAG TPA: type I phosphomannose isomerase catalytic subunit [Gemmataceae bacterium]|nr:type I phosphomannose isomerase catalytic subunit [Gemmataceae bacterium]
MLPTLQQPLRFEPFLRPMVWGGRRIARFLGKNVPPGTRCGESWEVSDHPLHASSLATATGYGITLHQLMEHHRAELFGPAAERHSVFPWLIKLLDADDWLSVQVHPDDVAVLSLCPSERAKTEAWYILDAEPTARIYAGLNPGIGPTELREALNAGKVDACLHAFTPKVGDCVYLPAGTVHAVGGGVLMAEIQQTSDATFRLFDWNRVDAQGKPRALHLDQGFASIHWNQGPIAPVASDHSDQQPLVRCPYFEIERVRWNATPSVGGANRLQALIVTDGYGRFANGEFVMPGDAWILPAALPPTPLALDTPLTGLLCTLP